MYKIKSLKLKIKFKTQNKNQFAGLSPTQRLFKVYLLDSFPFTREMDPLKELLFL